MKFFLKVFTLFFITFFVGLFFAKPAFADTFTLSGRVSDNLNNSLDNATIDVIDTSNSTTVASTTTDSGGNYTAVISGGTYNVQVTPPAGSNFSSAIALNQNIFGNTTLNFILVPAGTVSLSGHIYDEYGNPLPNQTVHIARSGGGWSAVSDASGFYSFVPLSPGQYDYFEVMGSNNGGTLNLPSFYDIQSFNFPLNESMVKDVNLNARKVTIHVQDTEGNPIENVSTSVRLIDSSTYGSQTDGSGNSILWLFDGHYSIAVSPPNGGGFLFTSANANISQDQIVNVTLQEPVMLSGHIYDEYGNPLPNQTVHIARSGGGWSAVSDASGFYSFVPLSPGQYDYFEVMGSNNGGTLNLPSFYDIQSFNFPLNESMVKDVNLNARKVTIHVQDTEGAPVNNVNVSVRLIDNSVYSSQTNSSGDGILWLFDGNYSIAVSPPNGSGFLFTSANANISQDQIVNVTLQEPVMLSGHIYDEYGNPLPNQTVHIARSGGAWTEITDAAGFYSFDPLSPGQYDYFEVMGSNNGGTLNLPSFYDIQSFNFSLNESIVKDVTLNARKVTIHVQDGAGNPLNNVSTSVRLIDSSTYGSQTDGSGNSILWLFDGQYTISVTPPSGSIYSNFTLSNVAVSTDQTELVSLQYNHNPPTTVEDLITQHANGTYSDPTTVTLSATADTGYTIANTYYTVDGDGTQSYTDPFTVSGEGSHTITYWSIDNSGVQEAHHSKNFSIHTNQAPYVNPLSGATIAEGETYTEDGSFTDADSSSWTATVDYDEGAGPQALGLNGMIFNLSNQYDTAGEYTVTVVVRDNEQNTGTTFTSVIVVEPTPTPTNTPTPTPTNTPTPTPTLTPVQLTELSPAKVWVGLKNSDDNGLDFDLKAEAYKDGVLVSSGQLNSFDGGSTAFIHAHLATIPFDSFTPVNFTSGSQLSIKVSVRNACVGSGKNSGFARLWFNDSQANSRFDATIRGNNSDYYLRDLFALAVTAGPGPKKTIDVQSGAKCSAFKSFGTWSVTP